MKLSPQRRFLLVLRDNSGIKRQVCRTLKRRLDDIRGLLDKLDAFMLSVNKVRPQYIFLMLPSPSVKQRIIPKSPHPEPFLNAVPLPPPSARKADLPVFQRLAPSSDVTSGPDADLFRPTEEESSLLPLEPSLDATTIASPVRLPPGTPRAPLSSTTGDATPTQALLQHRTVLQEELSAQLAQMAGQLRRNAEHFSSALAADQAVLRNAEEKIGANFDVMKQERVRLRDHRSKSLGTTCLTITSVLVVLIAFVIVFFILRLT
jgi:Membrane fusion protein Use1